MAFVFRSERGIINPINFHNDNYNNYNSENLSTKPQENTIKDTDLMNNRYNSIIDSPAPPFLSGAERNKSKNDENSPGPGTYNISKGYYNKHRQFSSRQENSKPEEYEIFDLPLLRMKGVTNNNPGPGYYHPSEKDLFGGKFKTKNKPKILINRNNNSSLSNISHSVNNIFRKDKNKEKVNNSIEINKNMNKLVLIYSSKKRKNENEQNLINKDNNLNQKKVSDCGEIFENISMKNIRPLSIQSSESDNKHKNNRDIKYNNSKISGITLDTERTSINTSKLSHSQIRNRSSKLLQNLKRQLNSNNQDRNLYNNIITEQNTNKSNTLFPVSLKYDKSRIYKNEYNHERLLLSKEQDTNYLINNTEFDKLLNSEYFSQSPGPGYYDPIDIPYQKYFKPNYNLSYFNRFKTKNVTSLLKLKKIKNMSPGPGEYTDNNMIENKIKNNISKKMRDILFDVKRIAKLRIIREKEAIKRNEDIKLFKDKYQDNKPKYENNSKEIFQENSIDYRNMHSPNDLLYNFGSNEKRLPDIKNSNYPGPGEYDVNLYKSIEEKNANIKERPTYQELYDKTENKNNLNERSSLNKDLINNPPVGHYNPDIISSIKYNAEYKYKMRPPFIHKRDFNPVSEKMTLEKVKEIKEKEKKLISYLGPGKYYNILKSFNDKNSPLDNIKPPFGSSEKKLKDKKQELYPGPGQYNIDSYSNWITRTYNVLFC